MAYLLRLRTSLCLRLCRERENQGFDFLKSIQFNYMQPVKILQAITSSFNLAFQILTISDEGAIIFWDTLYFFIQNNQPDDVMFA